MEPKEFELIVSILKMVEQVAPKVYEAARTSVYVWVWRDIGIFGLLSLVSVLVSSVFLKGAIQTGKKAKGEGDYVNHRLAEDASTLLWVGIVVGAFALFSIVTFIVACANLLRIDYLTIQEVLYLIRATSVK